MKSAITQKVRKTKYFSNTLNCTLDISNKEQSFFIIRFVDVSGTPI